MLSDESVQCNAAGQVELELKTPWRDGAASLLTSPLEFMERLVAQAPVRCAQLLLNRAWKTSANDWCLPTNTGRRMAQ